MDLGTVQDVHDVFVRYVRGQIPSLPWCEASLALESTKIGSFLVALNRYGFLTINSQPRVNGESSTDPSVGWGSPGGYVYQKAYLEFFVCPEMRDRLLALMSRYPTLTWMSVNRAGELSTSPGQESSTNAVTCGVFPGQEILQPTVVDAGAFVAWKDEAFHLWESMWAAAYPADSPARAILDTVCSTYYLFNIVDNDFIHGDIFSIFAEIFADGPTLRPVNMHRYE